MGIWFGDDRTDFYDIQYEQVRKNAGCVAIICLKDNLIEEKNGFSTLKVKNYGKTFSLCDNEPFHDQPILKGISFTGFLVKEDIIATAGYVFKGRHLRDFRFVFGFRMDGPYKPETQLHNDNIYKGVKIIHSVSERGGNRADWALVQLDRKVVHQSVAKLFRKKIFNDQPVYVMGHPVGLPLKYAPGGKIDQVNGACFGAKLDVYSGNTGSPVFSNDTHEVVGMLVRGDTRDFRYTGKCWLSVIYPNPGIQSKGAECTKVSEFIGHIHSINRVKKSPENYLEGELRKAVSAGLYQKAQRYLENVIQHSPESEERLKREFGFIDNVEEREKIEWRRKAWQVLSERNSFILKSAGDESINTLNTKVIKPSQAHYTRKGKTSSQIGSELETPVLKLFEEFLSMCDEEFNIEILEISKKRKQKGGSQYGYDLELACQIRGNKGLNIRIECKNYAKEIKLRDITEKLAMAKINFSNDPIDHWIVISPFASPTNDLNLCLNTWENTGEYPFKVQVWNKETGVDQFFGLVPGIYDIFFKPSHGQAHPRDWDIEKRREVIESWSKKLEPPLRLPKGWEQYLRNRGKFLLHGDPTNLESIYQNHVTMNCKDDKDAFIWGKTLEDKVNEWLEKPVEQHPTLILLGEFGDGKTVFSYILSRKLAEEFLESPSDGWLPVRFSLKDFSFENVKTSRDFVRRRLEEFGADVNGWDTLRKGDYKLLAILDGFDEISKKLDHKTILKNIKKIIECYQNEFSGMKLLITSRKNFFENQEHKEQLLQRIGNPQLLMLAPIDRKKTEEHLKEYARDIGEEEKFNKLKNYHDPIGLASKPLFLEMIKVSLKELPNKDLDELILYETYTRQSLERKSEYLEDENLETSPKTIIDNMTEILENLAVKLHQSDAEFIYLSQVHGSQELLKRLWKMSNPTDCTHDDEMGRIAVRSLLKRVGTAGSKDGKQWPVDFCHRSMREYFVARAVCKMLEHYPEQAKQFLRNYYLSYEIVFFAGKMMQKSRFDYSENLWQLIRETRGHNEREKFKVGHLGSNAANLLFQSRETLPNDDWSYLVLDGVDFSGADLSGKNFSHTSFHYANLDNVNFTNADFSYCDLTGVRLEEASPVHDVTVSRDENIYALYDDGVIREWKYKGVRTPYSVNLEEIRTTNNILLIAQPGNDVSIVNGRHLIFYDKEKERLKQRAQIEIKPTLRLLKAFPDSLLLIKEPVNQHILQLVDLDNQVITKSMKIEPFSLVAHIGTIAFVIYNSNKGLQIVDATSQKRKTIVQTLSENITCLATCPRKDSPDQYRIAFGQADGAVVILEIFLPQWEVKKIFECHYHEKTVHDIAFIDEDRVISGGFDKKIFLVRISQEENSQRQPLEFKLNLQCRGMKINGIKPDEKRLFLETLLAKASFAG